MVIDKDHQIILANRAVYKMFHYQEGKLEVNYLKM